MILGHYKNKKKKTKRNKKEFLIVYYKNGKYKKYIIKENNK